MKKKALLAVLLAMTMLLSSCALIVKDEAVDDATVILKLGDKEVTKAEVKNAVDNELYEMYQYYTMFGSTLDVSDPNVIASAQSSVIAELKEDMVLRAKIEELGLADQLTEEDNETIQEDAQDSWDYARSYVKSYYLSEDEKALEGDELEQAIDTRLAALGVTFDDYVTQAKDKLLETRLKDVTVKDITVSDEEVQADFDSKAAAGEEKYKDDPEAWATADRSGTTLYYTPAGIRRIKQILVKFKEDDQAAIDEANQKISDAGSKITESQTTIDSEEATEEEKQQAEEARAAAEADKAAAEAELKEATDKAFENLDEEADAILAALAEDPDSWDQLAEEKNEDPGMKAGATNAETGYAVFSGMTSFDSAFVEAAMALESVGDISGKVRGETYGYYILKYVGDETEGPIDISTVKDAIHDNLLSTKQTDFYNTTVDEWVEKAGIKENLGALKN